MTDKSETRAYRRGMQHRLAVLVNIPRRGDPESLKRAEEFLSHYGPLRKDIKDASSVLLMAELFRVAWDKKESTEEVSRFLENIFMVPMTERPGGNFYGEPALPALMVDLISRRRRFRFKIRDLLDALAMEFIKSRKMLSRCEHPACKRYFVKQHSRQKFCGTVCSEEHIKQYQAEWVRKDREKQGKGKRHAKRNRRKN